MSPGSTALIRKLVDLSASARTVAEYYDETIAVLAKTVGFDNAVVFSPRIVDGSPFVYGMDCEARSIVNRFFEGFDQYRIAPTRASELATIHEVITDDQVYANLGYGRDRDPFEADIIRPTGITSIAIMALKVGPETLGFVSLHRAGRYGRFSARETDLLKPLAPTLGLAVAGLQARSDHASSDALIARLTPRERQIAMLVRQGLCNNEIAARLGNSTSTVRNQLHNMFEKLAIRRRAELARIAGALVRSPRADR